MAKAIIMLAFFSAFVVNNITSSAIIDNQLYKRSVQKDSTYYSDEVIFPDSFNKKAPTTSKPSTSSVATPNFESRFFITAPPNCAPGLHLAGGHCRKNY